jgi:vacuolar iron transporter family protein
VDDFDYLPEYGWPSEEAAYGRYPDSEPTPPMGRHRGQAGPDYPPPRTNGVPQRLLTEGRRPPGRPPRGPRNSGGYPAASGPVQAYQPPDGRPGPGYPPPDGPTPPYPPSYNGTYPPSDSGPMPRAYRPGNSGPLRAYRPDGSGPMRAYRPDHSGPVPQAYRPGNSGPLRAYPPGDSGPTRAYQPPSGRSTSGHPRIGTGLLSDYPPFSEPILTYQPPADRAAGERSLPNGKEILGWLPFGGRLVLLPKEGAEDDELREHRDVNGGWLRPAVFGAMDGLVTNSSLIAGVGAGGGAHGAIVLTGIAGLIAGAFSMATGEYISVSSQNELTQAEVELERKQHARDPAGKMRRLAHLFVEKGVSPNLAEAVVRQISADPDRAVAAHVREELGLDPDDLPSPRTAAVASLSSFTVGALIPLAPFLAGYPVLKVALVISGAAAFAGGAAVAKLTGRSMVLGGLRQFTAAALATAAALLIGHLVGAHVS